MSSVVTAGLCRETQRLRVRAAQVCFDRGRAQAPALQRRLAREWMQLQARLQELQRIAAQLRSSAAAFDPLSLALLEELLRRPLPLQSSQASEAGWF